MTVPISPNQEIKSSELKGMANLANNSAYLTLSTSYQDLVAAPASGITRVNQIVLKNMDASVTADFYLKVIKSSTDYVVIQFQLAPYEKLVLDFPWLLDANTKLQAKLGASCTAVAEAGYVTWVGGNGVVNFSGTNWADLLEVAAGARYGLLGAVIQNSYTATQTVQLQVIDGSSNVKYADSKTLSPGAVWVLGLNLVMDAGWKVQVKHGAASYTGSAFASYMEVPA